MSGTLRVRSLVELEPAVVEAIIKDAQVFELDHDWWSEPLRLEAPHGDLQADAAIFLLGYEDSDGDWVDVDPDEDTFMAWHDLALMVGRLQKWSADHKVDWELFLEDDRIGQIEDGRPDDALVSFVRELAMTGGAKGDPRRDNARAKAIHFRHSLLR